MKLSAATRLAAHTHDALKNLWELLNDTCFEGSLNPPILIQEGGKDLNSRVEDFVIDHGLPHLDMRGNETCGLVLWDHNRDRAIIVINSGLNPKDLMLTMAHEMVHQKLAQELGYYAMCRAGHGPLFRSYKESVMRYKGLYLTDANFNKIS